MFFEIITKAPAGKAGVCCADRPILIDPLVLGSGLVVLDELPALRSLF